MAKATYTPQGKGLDEPGATRRGTIDRNSGGLVIGSESKSWLKKYKADNPDYEEPNIYDDNPPVVISAPKNQQKPKGNGVIKSIKNFAKNAAESAKETGEKSINTVGAATAGLVGLGTAGVQAATGNKQGAKRTIAGANQQVDEMLDNGLGGVGGYATSKQAASRGGGWKSTKENFIKPVSQGVTEIAPYVVPVARAKTLAGDVIAGAVQNAAMTAGTTLANEVIQGKTGTDDRGTLARNTATAALIGGLVPGLHATFKGGAKQALSKMKEDYIPKKPVEEPGGMEDVMSPKQADAAAAAAHTQINVAQPDAIPTEIGVRTPVRPGIKEVSQTDKIGVRTPVRPGIKQISQTDQIGVRAPVKMTDTQYASRFNEISKSYEKAYKELEAQPPVAQRVLSQSIDRQHQSMLDKLDGDYQHGIMPEKTTIKKLSSSISPAGKTTGGAPKVPVKKIESSVSPAGKPKGGLPKLGQQRRTPVAKPATRPNDELQTKIEQAHNAGNKELEAKLTAQLPDQAMNPNATMSAERRAELMAKMKKDASPEPTHGNPVMHLPQKGVYAKLTPEQQAHFANENKNITTSADDSVHLSQNGRTGKHKEVSLDELTSMSKNAKASVDNFNASSKTPETPATAPKSAEAPKSEAEGNLKTSGVAKSIEAKAIEKKLTSGFGDLAEFKGRNVQDQAEKIGKIIADEPDRMRRIVDGSEALPEGVSGSMFIKGVEEHALESGNVNLLRDLSRSQIASDTSIHASELRLLREREPDSALAHIRDLANARRKAAEGKLKTSSVDSEVKATATEIKKSIKKPSKMDWNTFVEGIKC